MMLLCCSSIFAQEIRSGYFLDTYHYSFHFNPAAEPDSCTKGFFGALISGVAADGQSNFGLSNYVFKKNGELYTGLNDNITADEFIGNLPDYSNSWSAVNLNLLSFGFRIGKGYLNAEVNVKENNNVSIPKTLFEFLKVGGTGNVYDINDLTTTVTGYSEVAVGFSYPIIKSLRFGITGKFLMGIASADMQISNINANLTSSIALNGKGSINIAAPFLEFGLDENGNYDFSDIEAEGFGFGGFGAALDLGLHWDTPLKGMSADIAVTDLGGINWKNNMNGVMNYTSSYKAKDLDELEENLSHLLEFKPQKAGEKNYRSLHTTLNVGLKYNIPAAKWLTAGLLYTQRFGSYKLTDFRIGVNAAAGQMLNFSLNGGYTSFGGVFGGAINLRFWAINLYAGIDSMIIKFNSSMIPLNSMNTTAKAGIVFSLFKNK